MAKEQWVVGETVVVSGPTGLPDRLDEIVKVTPTRIETRKHGRFNIYGEKRNGFETPYLTIASEEDCERIRMQQAERHYRKVIGESLMHPHSLAVLWQVSKLLREDVPGGEKE